MVNVLDTTITSVEAGSAPARASRMSSPSTFETKSNAISVVAWSARARTAIAGPRSDPPIPMFTTVRIRSPVAPVQAPERTASAISPTRSSTSWTSGTTLRPSTSITASRGARSAVWSTARPSVTLIRSPANIASARRWTPRALGQRDSRSRVSRVTRFLE